MRGNRTIKCSSSNLNAFETPNMAPLVKAGINFEVDYKAIFRPKEIARSGRLCFYWKGSLLAVIHCTTQHISNWYLSRLRSTRLVFFLEQLWYKERRLLLSVTSLKFGTLIYFWKFQWRDLSSEQTWISTDSMLTPGSTGMWFCSGCSPPSELRPLPISWSHLFRALSCSAMDLETCQQTGKTSWKRSKMQQPEGSLLSVLLRYKIDVSK